MGRPRLYATPADRQAAYRLRSAALDKNAAQASTRPRRQPSRPTRLAMLVQMAEDLQHEYETWLESLPEALQDGDQAARLAETIEQLQAVVDLLSEVTPPRGFGRD